MIFAFPSLDSNAVGVDDHIIKTGSASDAKSTVAAKALSYG